MAAGVVRYRNLIIRAAGKPLFSKSKVVLTCMKFHGPYIYTERERGPCENSVCSASGQR